MSAPPHYQPIVTPYDTSVDVALEIEKARYQQRETGKLLLLNIGANWCPDAQALAGMMQVPQIAAYLGEHFIEVAFEIGDVRIPADYEKNTDIAASYGVSPMEGVPTILIVDPDNNLRNGDETATFRNARSRKPQELLTWLQRYV